jgi:2-oxo-4-hydroxy-4-carboxy-5-ureidoimidazoline decarboxylase
MSDHTFNPAPSEMLRDDFLAQFGGVYEKTPWIAESIFDAGLMPAQNQVDGLASMMAAAVDGADDASKLALLRAHPDLAGKLAAAGALTAESTAEQAGAGLDQCSAEELSEFQSLNAAYTSRFGFPFIIAVTGHQRAEILAIFRQRLKNDTALEFATALSEVHKIARIRLSSIANEGL